ncbi:MAG TPA: homoserine kinase, partial [Rhodothermales bacterium]|nr:homoserine kinase [Rhodothermales bacterium]
KIPNRPPDAVVAAPASLSNLGPGFDTLGLALDGLDDTAEVWSIDTPSVTAVAAQDGAAWTLPPDARNTAVIAARAVLHHAGREDAGLVLRLRKAVTPGSGLGSSAASAVAGALGAAAALGLGADKADLIEAVLEGEAAASGAWHGDNAVPSLLGGLVLVSATDPTRYRRLTLGAPLHLAVLLPQVQVLTKAARAMLPASVPLRDAVSNTTHLAFLIHALQAGDVDEAGRCIMQDRLVEPVRATLVPCYTPVRRAALDAGAYGAALSGSGPAIFALCRSRLHAQRTAEAMREASEAHGIEANAYACATCEEGARVVERGAA